MAQVTSFQKFLTLRSAIKNWPLVVIDKFGLKPTLSYTTRTGLTITCRSRSTDINEAVVVLSGMEYPKEYVKVSKGAVVLDLGANIGSFCLYFDEVNRGTAYKGFAFEPFAETAKVLRENLAQNKITKFKVIEAAISEADGTVNLDVSSGFDAVSITEAKNQKSGQGVTAESIRLKTFCDSKGITDIELLKMDVEGAEYAIIAKDLPFIARHVKRGIIEYHNISAEHDGAWVKAQLGKHFVITDIHTGTSNGVIAIHNKLTKDIN